MAQLPEWFVGSPTPEPQVEPASRQATRQSDRLRVKRERRSPSPSARHDICPIAIAVSHQQPPSVSTSSVNLQSRHVTSKPSGDSQQAQKRKRAASSKRARQNSSEYEVEETEPIRRKKCKSVKKEKIEDRPEDVTASTQVPHRVQRSAWKTSKVSEAMLAALDLGGLEPIHVPAPATALRHPPAPRKKATQAQGAETGETSVRPDPIPVNPSPPTSLILIDQAEQACPQPRGISSSKFCRILRLVCGIRRHTPEEPLIKRAQPRSRPPVWADSRQELCETLPYYRAYQAGLHMYRKVAYGYLLEGFGAPRDVWADEGRVVISHGGGQCIRPPTATNDKVPAVLQADQSPTDARVATLIEAARRKTPIVLIAGEGYDLLPWKLDCTYVVLGWYWISATWVEAEPVASGVKAPPDRDWFHRVKIRFDWIESQGTPWWLLDNQASSSDMPDPGSPMLSSTAMGLPGDVSLRERLRVKSLLNPAPKPVRVDDEHVDSAIMTAHGLLTPPDTPPQPTFGRRTDSSASRRVEAASTSALTISQALNVDDQLMDNYGRRVSICPICSKESLQVYEEGWTCLQPACPAFWLLATTVGLLPIPPGFRLRYSPDFLRQVSTPPHAIPPYSVCPPSPSDDLLGAQMGDRRLQTGWVCECGRANCRYRWDCWECRACGKQTHRLTRSNVVLEAAMPRRQAFLGDARVIEQMRTEIRRLTSPAATVMLYHLPRGGQVYHVIPDVVDDADDLFEQYQEEALYSPRCLFERRPLKSIHTVKGATLAQHFALNSGAAYKYAVDTVSVPFDESPDCVLSALDHIRHYTSAVLGEPATFNEVLSVLYREGQKMSWHDDGEEGLGPVVASLSLGSTATMSFRPKAPRKDTSRRFDKGGSNKSTRPHAEASLSLTLSHGDVVIMTGYELQRRYEHRVLPDGLRVAATARYISPSHGGSVDAG